MGDNFEFEDTEMPVCVLPELSKDITVNPEILLSQLRFLAQNPDVLRDADPAQRREIQRLSTTAARSLEEPYETMMRHMYAVSRNVHASSNSSSLLRLT